MKKLLLVFIISLFTLTVLVSCTESVRVKNITETEKTKAVDEKKDINDFVTIKESVNKEDVSPNGDKVKYIYEIPVINIAKPGAQKVNELFLNLEKIEENRIGNGQSMTLFIKSKAFLNDGIISIIMEIKKPGPGGVHTVNYDIENDKEINTKELIEKYKFDPQKLISEINEQTKIDKSKPSEERSLYGDVIDFFIDTVIVNSYPSGDVLNKMEEMRNKTKEEKESYVIENIDKLKVYINNDDQFVFIHQGPLEDRELVID